MSPSSASSILARALSLLLDPTIVFSYDRTGYRLHSQSFREGDLDVDLEGRICLVTGANSGIGFATAKALANRGARTWLLCRSAERGQAAVEAIRDETGNNDVHLALVDLADLDSVRAFGASFRDEQLDILINNAGILPDTLQRSPQGHELTFATNVLGHFLLTHLMRGRLRDAEGARVLTVSSGGMYTQRLDIPRLLGDVETFDGVAAYAQTKRAQVILNELWAEELAPAEVDCHAMHPGWVNTSAVKTSLPTFYRMTRPILRNPDEGADTLVWLAVCRRLRGRTGEFWFDREPRATHLFAATRATTEERRRLWEICMRACGLSP